MSPRECQEQDRGSPTPVSPHWHHSRCPSMGQPLLGLLPDPKAPNTHIPKSRRTRHPAVALHTGKSRAEPWWQVQKEIPGLLVLIPAHWKNQIPQQLKEPTQTPRNLTNPMVSSSPNTPNPTCPRPLLLPSRVPAISPAWKSSKSQPSLCIPAHVDKLIPPLVNPFKCQQ